MEWSMFTFTEEVNAISSCDSSVAVMRQYASDYFQQRGEHVWKFWSSHELHDTKRCFNFSCSYAMNWKESKMDQSKDMKKNLSKSECEQDVCKRNRNDVCIFIQGVCMHTQLTITEIMFIVHLHNTTTYVVSCCWTIFVQWEGTRPLIFFFYAFNITLKNRWIDAYMKLCVRWVINHNIMKYINSLWSVISWVAGIIKFLYSSPYLHHL